jgi:hypothetical protein
LGLAALLPLLWLLGLHGSAAGAPKEPVQGRPEGSRETATQREQAPELPVIRATAVIDPPFDTGKWQIEKGFASCSDPRRCTLLQARDPRGRTVHLDGATTLVRMFPPASPEHAANLAGFLLDEHLALTDVSCSTPPTVDGHYRIPKLETPIPVRPLRFRMDGNTYVIRQVEACPGDPDRLVDTDLRLGPGGSIERVEVEVLAATPFLDRGR